MTREEVRELLREELNLRIKVVRMFGQSAYVRIIIELDGKEVTYDTLDLDQVIEP